LAHVPLSAILDWHKQRYPLLRAEDIYKLVHQGVFGPGHIITSAARARRALNEEMAALEVQCPGSEVQSQSKPEFEPIDPDGELVRVKLKPLVAAQCKMQSAECKMQNAGWLAEALVESARRVKGNPEQMGRRLAAAVRWCRKNLPQQAAELERLATQAEESGYPAFHHSPAYSRAYRPAYRVVLRTCLDSRARLGRKGRTKREARKQAEGRNQKLDARCRKCRKLFCALASCLSLLASFVPSAVLRASGRPG